MGEIEYIYRANGAWVLRSDGHASKTFKTQREAIAYAKGDQTRTKRTRIVVFRSDGQFKVLGESAKIEQYPKNARSKSRKISAAVGRVVLDRLRSSVEHGA